MRTQTITAALMTAATVLPMAVFGQDTYEPGQWWDDRWYITPFGGYVFKDDDRRADDGW